MKYTLGNICAYPTCILFKPAQLTVFCALHLDIQINQNYSQLFAAYRITFYIHRNI